MVQHMYPNGLDGMISHDDARNYREPIERKLCHHTLTGGGGSTEAAKRPQQVTAETKYDTLGLRKLDALVC